MEKISDPGPERPKLRSARAFFFVNPGAEPVTYITGSNLRFEILVLAERFTGPNGLRGGHMVSELTTGVLAAMGWLVVSAVLTLVAVFVATALA